jgi:23S rRNA pseudouridine1911/1915/1917 synthase
VRDPCRKAVPGARTKSRAASPKAHNEAQDIALEIVFEDEHLLVVDKPAGMVVHPPRAITTAPWSTPSSTIAPGACRASAASPGRHRPPHRQGHLGLLVVAKTDVAHEGLAAQFARHSIDRRYQAVVGGVPTAPRGTVDAPLARSSANRQKMAIVADGRGKRAVTHYAMVRPLHDAALVECRLETGRTHQSGSIWRRSATRWSATRFMDGPVPPIGSY